MAGLALLQWGRSCSERKTVGLQAGADGCGTASMGPLLFRAEDKVRGRVLQFMGAASMGPLLFRAEDDPRRAAGET